jgi:hypothetical protein
MALSATAIGLAYWATQLSLPDTDPRGYLFLFPGALGLLMGLVTVVVGLVATLQRCQVAWLIGLVAVWLATMGGPLVVGRFASGNPVASFFLAGPLLVGLVYSFRMRAPAATSGGGRAAGQRPPSKGA